MSFDPSVWARRVRLQHLRAVLVVAQSKSLAQASTQLGLTQSAITKILQEVESELEVQLFERTSRGTHATPMGLLVVEHAKLIFTQLEQAAQAVHDTRQGLVGRVRVGALIAGAALLLPRAVAQMQMTRPGVLITIVEGTYDYLMPLLRQGELDFVIGRLPSADYREGIEVESLYEERIALAVRPHHPALALEQPSLHDLLQWPWIVPLAGTTLRQLIETSFYAEGLNLPPIRCESVSVVFNLRLIKETDSIGAFPLEVIKLDLENGVLASVPCAALPSFGPVGISMRQGGGVSPAAQSMLQALRAVALETSL